MITGECNLQPVALCKLVGIFIVLCIEDGIYRISIACDIKTTYAVTRQRTVEHLYLAAVECYGEVLGAVISVAHNIVVLVRGNGIEVCSSSVRVSEARPRTIFHIVAVAELI